MPSQPAGRTRESYHYELAGAIRHSPCPPPPALRTRVTPARKWALCGTGVTRKSRLSRLENWGVVSITNIIPESRRDTVSRSPVDVTPVVVMVVVLMVYWSVRTGQPYGLWMIRLSCFGEQPRRKDDRGCHGSSRTRGSPPVLFNQTPAPGSSSATESPCRVWPPLLEPEQRLQQGARAAPPE